MTAGQRAAPHLVTLVMAAAIGPLAMNVFLPSLPGMARHFDTDYAVMQLAVSLYLGATALLQLFIGPASDRFGRRPVMLVCFAIFLVGTVAAVYAPTVEALLVCRLLQAFSSAGMVISRAVVRDTVGTAEAASQIGYITMGMSVVPMVGPMIGGFLDELYGWQAGFWLTLGLRRGRTRRGALRSRRDQPQPVGQLRRAVPRLSGTARLAAASGAIR